MKLVFILFISYQLAFLNLVVAGLSNDSLKADRFYQTADSLYFESRYDSSNHYFKLAAELFKKSQNWERYLGCCKNIGFNLGILGELDLALNCLNRAAELAFPYVGSSKGIGGIYNSMGTIYYRKSNFKKSMEYFDKNIEIINKIYGANDKSLAFMYDNKGLVYQAIGDYGKAKELSLMALNILLQLLPSDHLELSTLYNNSGEIFQLMGDNFTALEFHTKALNIRLKNLGNDHLQVGGSYLNIGNIYEDNEEYDIALMYYEKTLKIWENILEPNHLYIALCYNNIGLIMNSLRNYRKALELYNKTLLIQLNSPEKDDPTTANTYINIGNTFLDMALTSKKKIKNHQYPDSLFNIALLNFKECLKIREKIFGKGNLKVAETLVNMGDICSQKLEFEKAEAYYDSTIKIFQKFYKPWDRNFSLVKYHKAKNHILNGYLSDGLLLLQESLTGMVLQTPNHQTFSNANLKFKKSGDGKGTTENLYYPLLLKILVAKAEAFEIKWDKEN